MGSIKTLLEFDDIRILCQYLYGGNEVTYSNDLINVTMSMAEDLEINYRPVGSTKDKEFRNDSQSSVAGLLGVIEQIKEEPFKETWEYICMGVNIHVAHAKGFKLR